MIAVFAASQFCGQGSAQTKSTARLLDAEAMKAGSVETLLHVTIVEHKSKNLKLATPFEDVAVGAPEIADAVPISDRELYILGKHTGTTNILIYGPEKKLIGIVDVEVKLDTRSLGAKIREASGDRNIDVEDVDGKLVIKGSSGDSETAQRAMQVAAGLGPAGVVNALKVTTPQQVMLKVRIVEADREAARNLGVRWEFFKQNGNLAGVVGSQTGTNKFQVGPGPFAFGPVPPATAAPVFDVVGGSMGLGSPFATVITQIVNTAGGKLDAVLSALEEQQVIRQLAEPDLVALSGETATFLAGGEYPIPVVSAASAGTLPTVTIEYKEFGVKLNFTPTVLSRGVISLKVLPEVSQIDPTLSVVISGTSVPGLKIRKAQTTVELRDGQTFAIAGLLQSVTNREVDQLPWLGTLPVLGALFRSTQFQQNESELVVLVTPYLVKPVPPGKQLKTPLDTSLAGNDVDLFLNGRPEVPKQPPAIVNGVGRDQNLMGAIQPGAPDAPPPNPIAIPVPEPVAVAPAPLPPAPDDPHRGQHWDPFRGYVND